MEKVTTAAGVRAGQGKNQEQGDDDMMINGRWRQEWSNTMVQCGMMAVGVRSGATPWSSAVWIRPWQGSIQ